MRSYSLQDVPVRGRESQDLRASFSLWRRQRALVSPGVARSHAGRHLQWDERDVRFTVEEYKVVRLVVRAYTDREIGRELFMSEWTVRYHLRKVFRRLAIRRRVELVGFLSVGPRVSGDDRASQEDFGDPIPVGQVGSRAGPASGKSSTPRSPPPSSPGSGSAISASPLPRPPAERGDWKRGAETDSANQNRGVVRNADAGF